MQRAWVSIYSFTPGRGGCKIFQKGGDELRAKVKSQLGVWVVPRKWSKCWINEQIFMLMVGSVWLFHYTKSEASLHDVIQLLARPLHFGERGSVGGSFPTCIWICRMTFHIGYRLRCFMASEQYWVKVFCQLVKWISYTVLWKLGKPCCNGLSVNVLAFPMLFYLHVC